MTEKRLKFKTSGERTIHCSGCENSIRRALTRIAGVQHVQASHTTQLIELTLDADTTTPERVKQELELIGYQVVEV